MIDFREIEEFIKDTNQISGSDNFSNVAGIKYFTFRDFVASTYVYDYGSSNYPQYYYSEFEAYIDNVIRPIKLGPGQFPQVTEDSINISSEG